MSGLQTRGYMHLCKAQAEMTALVTSMTVLLAVDPRVFGLQESQKTQFMSTPSAWYPPSVWAEGGMSPSASRASHTHSQRWYKNAI